MPSPVITVIHEPRMSFGPATAANRNLLESIASLTRSDHFLTQGPLPGHAYCQQFIDKDSAQHTLHLITGHYISSAVLRNTVPLSQDFKELEYVFNYLLHISQVPKFGHSLTKWHAFVKWNRWINDIVLMSKFLFFFFFLFFQKCEGYTTVLI